MPGDAFVPESVPRTKPNAEFRMTVALLPVMRGIAPDPLKGAAEDPGPP